MKIFVHRSERRSMASLPQHQPFSRIATCLALHENVLFVVPAYSQTMCTESKEVLLLLGFWLCGPFLPMPAKWPSSFLCLLWWKWSCSGLPNLVRCYHGGGATRYLGWNVRNISLIAEYSMFTLRTGSLLQKQRSVPCSHSFVQMSHVPHL